MAAADEGPNPLLPWAVQAELNLPGAKPETALAASIEDLGRLRRRVTEARFSCPARVGDEPRMPSPLIAGWQGAGIASGQGGGGYAAARIGARNWLSAADPAPPFTGNAIPGGARTLDLQSGCPVRAFCAARLEAEPVEPPVRGVDPRLRGLLLHRALELVLDPAGPGLEAATIAAAVDRAVAGIARRAGAVWRTQLRAERNRLERIIARLLEIDASRAPFATIAVELRTRIPVGSRVVNCRIDRIDRLAAGGHVLIDYKTGRSPLSRWFDARLGDCQLPLYALGSEPDAIAAIRLDAKRIDYRWAARMPLSLPGSGRSFDGDGWRAQIGRWGDQIGELVAEFAAGDVRLPFDSAEHVAADGADRAGGAFAPLTRVGAAR
jgi:RecB family exonuclease